MVASGCVVASFVPASGVGLGWNYVACLRVAAWRVTEADAPLWACGLWGEVEFHGTEGVSEATRQTTGSTGEICFATSVGR